MTPEREAEIRKTLAGWHEAKSIWWAGDAIRDLLHEVTLLRLAVLADGRSSPCARCKDATTIYYPGDVWHAPDDGED